MDEAARTADIHDRILTFPEGTDSMTILMQQTHALDPTVYVYGLIGELLLCFMMSVLLSINLITNKYYISSRFCVLLNVVTVLHKSY